MASLTAPGPEGSLSSVPSNITEHSQMLHEVRLRLQGYTSASTGVTDHTVTLLSAFIECLPKNGVVNIAQDILNSNNEGLRMLAQHLLTAVLIPSKYSLEPNMLQCEKLYYAPSH